MHWKNSISENSKVTVHRFKIKDFQQIIMGKIKYHISRTVETLYKELWYNEMLMII